MVGLVRSALFGVVAVVAASGIAVPGVGHCAAGGSYFGGIAPDSKVRITYEGAFQGVAVVRDRSRDSRVTFGGVKLNFEGTREVPIEGTYRVVVNYDGASVSGVETQSSSVPGMTGDFKFQGQRVGSNCMLTFDIGQQATANCTRTEFSYNSNLQTAQGVSVRIRFEGRATSVVDVVEEARLKAEAKAKADREAAAKAAETRRNMDKWLAWAGSGDALAMGKVGNNYLEGEQGFPRDPKQALHWFTRGASAGDVLSASGLGVIYADGEGVERSRAKSHGFILQCASGRLLKSPNFGLSAELIESGEKLITACMFTVAENFELGRGVLRDDVQALGWYRRCAKRGYDKCISWMNDRGVN